MSVNTSVPGPFPSDDVLRIIFEQLEIPASNTNGIAKSELLEAQRTLALSARVCKTFHGHAIRVLWRHLDNLFPLFSLLSSFVQVAEDEYMQTATFVSAEDECGAMATRVLTTKVLPR